VKIRDEESRGVVVQKRGGRSEGRLIVGSSGCAVILSPR
jgi:hypothetical protein